MADYTSFLLPTNSHLYEVLALYIPSLDSIMFYFDFRNCCGQHSWLKMASNSGGYAGNQLSGQYHSSRHGSSAPQVLKYLFMCMIYWD